MKTVDRECERASGLATSERARTRERARFLGSGGRERRRPLRRERVRELSASSPTTMRWQPECAVNGGGGGSSGKDGQIAASR